MSVVVEKLESCIHDFSNTNEVITNSAMSTQKDCNNSFQFAESVCQSVASSGEDTVAQGQQVLAMVQQMQDILENTLNQSNQIVQESATQREAAKEVEVSFHQVNDVSKDLLSIG